jgi:hypothetical protein
MTFLSELATTNGTMNSAYSIGELQREQSAPIKPIPATMKPVCKKE